MDAKTYLDQYGPETAGAVAIDAGTNLVYFKQIASGFRKPSPDLAKKLEAASDGALTRHELRPDIFDPPQASE